MAFNHKKLKREDFSFTYDHYGYQLTYKGISIGGAGSNSRGRKNRSNLNFYKQQAKIAIRNIVEQGVCPNFMKQNICDIDYGKLEWLRA